MKEIPNILVFIEDAASEILEDRKIIEIDSLGDIKNELLILYGLINDLGSC